MCRPALASIPLSLPTATAAGKRLVRALSLHSVIDLFGPNWPKSIEATATYRLGNFIVLGEHGAAVSNDKA